MLSTTSCDPLDGYDRIHPSRILPVDGCRVVTQATVDPLLPERYLKFHGLEQIILVSFTNFLVSKGAEIKWRILVRLEDIYRVGQKSVSWVAWFRLCDSTKGHTFLAIVEPGSPLKHCFTHIFLDVNVLHGPQVQVGGDPNRSLPLVRPHPGVVDLQPWVVRTGVHEVAEGTRIARREAPRAVPEKWIQGCVKPNLLNSE